MPGPKLRFGSFGELVVLVLVLVLVVLVVAAEGALQRSLLAAPA